MLTNLKLVLEFDGTNFFGWQKQPSLRTVQGELEKAIRKISGEKTGVVGSGRTDTGVHAEALAANVKTRSKLSPQDWVRALNYHLPGDLVVLSARRVSDRFHARFSAKGKTYRYQILNRRTPGAIGKSYFWEVYQPLDIRAMKSAAGRITGRRDFSSFQVDRAEKIKKGGSPSSICNIREIEIKKKGDVLSFRITGNRFLQQMVRSIVGTLVEVGRGKMRPEAVENILKKKDRRFAGPTAPAKGLIMERVFYS